MVVNDRRDENGWRKGNPNHFLVVATDKFMSGWGLAQGGKSVAAWACVGADLAACEAAIRSRKEMSRVRVVGADYRPRGAAHFSIYVWQSKAGAL